jgi:hypothetical protein
MRQNRERAACARHQKFIRSHIIIYSLSTTTTSCCTEIIIWTQPARKGQLEWQIAQVGAEIPRVFFHMPRRFVWCNSTLSVCQRVGFCAGGERAGWICGRCAAAKEWGGKKCWKRKFPGTMPQTFRIFALAILRAGQKSFLLTERVVWTTRRIPLNLSKQERKQRVVHSWQFWECKK